MPRGYDWISFEIPKTTTVSKTFQPLITSSNSSSNSESFFGASPGQLPGQIDTRWWTSRSTSEKNITVEDVSYLQQSAQGGGERFFFGGVGGAADAGDGMTSGSTAINGTTSFRSWSTGNTRTLDAGGKTIDSESFSTRIVTPPPVVKIPKTTTTNQVAFGIGLQTATTTQEDYTTYWTTTLDGTKKTITFDETTFEGVSLDEDNFITVPISGLTQDGEYEFTLGADAISEKVVVYDTVWIKNQNGEGVTYNILTGGNFLARSTDTTGADNFSFVESTRFTVPWVEAEYKTLPKTSRQTTQTENNAGVSNTDFTTTTQEKLETITEWVNFTIYTRDEYIANVVFTKTAEDWSTYETIENGVSTILCSLNPNFRVREYETRTENPRFGVFAQSSKITQVPITVSYASYEVTSDTTSVILNTKFFNFHQSERITSFPFANNIAEIPWKSHEEKRYDVQTLITAASSKTTSTSFRSYPNSTHETSKKDVTNETLKKDGIGVDFSTRNATFEEGETSDGDWFLTYSNTVLVKLNINRSLSKKIWHQNGYSHRVNEKPFFAQQHAHPDAAKNDFSQVFAGSITAAPLLISLQDNQHTIPFVTFENFSLGLPFWTNASYVNQLAAALPIYPSYSTILNRNSDGGQLHTSDWSSITISRQGESLSSTWVYLQNESGANRTYTSESATCKIVTVSEFPFGITDFQRINFGETVWTAGGAMHPNRDLLVWNAPQVWHTIGFNSDSSQSGFSTDADFGYQSLQAGSQITISQPVGIYWGYGEDRIRQDFEE
jgi:hypothetical protein